MFRAFIKERELRANAMAHIKWSVAEYIEEYRSSTGSRIEHVGEFMCEGEYMDWAKKAKAGFLSEKERKANWRMWEKDLTVPRDNDGPENSVRLWVRTADQMTRFGEIAKNKFLQRTEKMNKNVSEIKNNDLLSPNITEKNPLELSNILNAHRKSFYNRNSHNQTKKTFSVKKY
jgi:hypothetical protein